MTNDKYPRWRERWNERLHDIDNEIVSWWERTRADMREAGTPREAVAGAWEETKLAGDRIGDRAAGRNDAETVAERIGDVPRNWWAKLKNNVHDWFQHEDEAVRNEYRDAWNDEGYVAERFEERRSELEKQGKLNR